MKYLFILIFILYSFNLLAQSFSIAKFSIGESRVKLDQNEFEIIHKSENVIAKFIPNSVQWIRNESNLLIPRTLMGISMKSETPNIYVSYLNKTIIPVKKNNSFYTEIYVDLYNPGEVKIFQNVDLVDVILIESKNSKTDKSKQLIDYSCSPYNLTIEGIDNEYLSVGCKVERVGKFLNEYPRLEVTLSSTNLKTLTKARPPFTVYLSDNSPAYINVLDSNQNLKTITLKASLPKKLTRLKMSGGLGPYIYNASDTGVSSKAQFAPSFMLYGKFDLTENTSVKAFDALVYSKSLFNNSGLYFSYDLAEIFDGRVLLNTLLGFQGINYRYSKDTRAEMRVLYPQGFEVIYKHAFGIQNKHLFYGMFLSTSGETYTNSWIRYGGRTFTELNYIKWGQGDKKISMIGLSIGFPLLEAF